MIIMKKFLLCLLVVLSACELTGFAKEPDGQDITLASNDSNTTLGHVWVDTEVYPGGLKYWLLRGDNISDKNQDVYVTFETTNDGEQVELLFTIETSYNSKSKSKKLRSFNEPIKIIKVRWAGPSLW